MNNDRRTPMDIATLGSVVSAIAKLGEGQALVLEAQTRTNVLLERFMDENLRLRSEIAAHRAETKKLREEVKTLRAELTALQEIVEDLKTDFMPTKTGARS